VDVDLAVVGPGERALLGLLLGFDQLRQLLGLRQRALDAGELGFGEAVLGAQFLQQVRNAGVGGVVGVRRREEQ
jgi:hypothetical protein